MIDNSTRPWFRSTSYCVFLVVIGLVIFLVTLKAVWILAILGFALVTTITRVITKRWRSWPSVSEILLQLSRIPALCESFAVIGSVALMGMVFFGSAISQALSNPLRIIGLAGIYLGILLMLKASIEPSRARQIWTHAGLVLFGIVLATILTEGGLRIISRSTSYLLLPRNSRQELHPAPDIMPGTSEHAIYSTNGSGIRGDPFQPSGKYNILAIGGSTTECLYLDDSKAWPYLLQSDLNATQPAEPFWVGNVGRSGHRLVHNLFTVEYFAPQLRLDAIVVMVGVNDLLTALADPASYQAGDALDLTSSSAMGHPDLALSTFIDTPLVDNSMARPFPENLALWNLLRRINQLSVSPQSILVEDTTGANYVIRRQLYQNAPIDIDKLPNLSSALDRYEANLAILIELSRRQKLRLILTTQPVIWSDHLSDAGKKLLWMGYAGQWGSPLGRYKVDALATAMQQFNDRLLAVCNRFTVECVDVASKMSGNETYFYDDVHFNELGAIRVAEILSDYLVKP